MIAKLDAADSYVTGAREDRDRVLREHYAAGVDPRDLVQIAKDAGWSTANAVHIGRIVSGARASA